MYEPVEKISMFWVFSSDQLKTIEHYHARLRKIVAKVPLPFRCRRWGELDA